MRPPRPTSILWFERLALLSIALGMVSGYLQWDETFAITARDGFGPGIVIALMVFGYGLVLLLLWLVVRRASNVAKWIYVVLSALGFLGLIDIANFRAQGDLLFGVLLVQYLLSAINLWLLFRADARNWLAGRSSVDPDIFS